MTALRACVLMITVACGTAACDGSSPPSCRCEGAVPGGTLSVACGGTQCLGGLGYRCTGINTAEAYPPACGIALDDGGPGACGPATCGGCCSGTRCESGSTALLCGTGGAACTACRAREVCTGGACVVDPASFWAVVLDTIRLDTTDYTGAAWDSFGGAPDPLVYVRVGSATAPQGSVDGPDDVFIITYTTANRIGFLRADALLTYLRFEIYDEDVASNDGVCTYTYSAASSPLQSSAFTGTTQTSTCTRDPARMISGMTLTWHLVPFP